MPSASKIDLETPDVALNGPTLYSTYNVLPKLIGDKRRLLQVLVSLVKNALMQT